MANGIPSSSNGGSTDTTNLDTTENGWTNEIRIENSTERTDESKLAMGLDTTLSAEMKVKGFGSLKGEMSKSIDTEDTTSKTNKHGFSAGGTDTQTTFHTDSTVTNSNWNSSKSYTSSKASSETESTTRELSKLIAENHHYGQSYILNEDVSCHQSAKMKFVKNQTQMTPENTSHSSCQTLCLALNY